MHVYTSMVCLLLVLFFSATGVTLNHPDWAFGGSVSRQTATGSLPAGWNQGGTINWLTVTEHLRSAHNVKGAVSSYTADDTQGSVTFKLPGYSAETFIDVAAGTYDLTVVAQGPIAVLNDLHKGRDTGSSWRWVIDVSGIFLVVLSLSGLFLQFFLRKRRRSAYVTASVGAVISLALLWIAMS